LSDSSDIENELKDEVVPIESISTCLLQKQL